MLVAERQGIINALHSNSNFSGDDLKSAVDNINERFEETRLQIINAANYAETQQEVESLPNGGKWWVKDG